MNGRAILLAAGYALALLAIHILVTRGTGAIPTDLKQSVGADAGSVLTRPWAQFTAPWFHTSWGHIGYNMAVLMATLPFAIHVHGAKTIPLLLLASALAGFAVNLLIILPLANIPYAASVVDGRLVGASIAIFAGAGIAWTTWTGAAWAKGAALGGFVLYEALLALMGTTQAFVGVYHVAGALAGIGIGTALKGS